MGVLGRIPRLESMAGRLFLVEAYSKTTLTARLAQKKNKPMTEYVLLRLATSPVQKSAMLMHSLDYYFCFDLKCAHFFMLSADILMQSSNDTESL